MYVLLIVKSNEETNIEIKYNHNIKDKEFEEYIKSTYELNLKKLL